MQTNNADMDYVGIIPNQTPCKDGSSGKQQIKDSGILCMGSTVWVELPLFLTHEAKNPNINYFETPGHLECV
jgi:hypothetical protein